MPVLCLRMHHASIIKLSQGKYFRFLWAEDCRCACISNRHQLLEYAASISFLVRTKLCSFNIHIFLCTFMNIFYCRSVTFVFASACVHIEASTKPQVVEVGEPSNSTSVCLPGLASYQLMKPRHRQLHLHRSNPKWVRTKSRWPKNEWSKALIWQVVTLTCSSRENGEFKVKCKDLQKKTHNLKSSMRAAAEGSSWTVVDTSGFLLGYPTVPFFWPCSSTYWESTNQNLGRHCHMLSSCWWYSWGWIKTWPEDSGFHARLCHWYAAAGLASWAHSSGPAYSGQTCTTSGDGSPGCAKSRFLKTCSAQ